MALGVDVDIKAAGIRKHPVQRLQAGTGDFDFRLTPDSAGTLFREHGLAAEFKPRTNPDRTVPVGGSFVNVHGNDRIGRGDPEVHSVRDECVQDVAVIVTAVVDLNRGVAAGVDARDWGDLLIDSRII